MRMKALWHVAAECLVIACWWPEDYCEHEPWREAGFGQASVRYRDTLGPAQFDRLAGLGVCRLGAAGRSGSAGESYQLCVPSVNRCTIKQY